MTETKVERTRKALLSFSTDIEDPRVLRLRFNRRHDDEDRAAIIEALNTFARHREAATRGEGVSASEAWQELVEYDDRTSPEEYPDMALITREELASFMERATHPTTRAAANVGRGVRIDWLSPEEYADLIADLEGYTEPETPQDMVCIRAMQALAKADAIFTALRQPASDDYRRGRREAIEEAAKVAEEFNTGAGVQRDLTAIHIADAIRALSPAPDGGENDPETTTE
jgi:hypothetical protein